MSEEKLIDIESRIAYQEHMLAELNDALTNQQSRISSLENSVRALTDRVRALSDAAPAGAAGDEKPPHY